MTTSIAPPKPTIQPDSALCLGGPLDGQLLDINKHGSSIMVPVRRSGLASFWQAENGPLTQSMYDHVRYRLEWFRGTVREFAFYIPDGTETDDAFAMIVMAYAVRRTGDDALQKIEAVR